jgi:hypothetical protein
MTNLFDNIIGSYTAADAESITDDTASWQENQFKNWYCIIQGDEYLITRNTATKLYFQNSVFPIGPYEIIFIFKTYILKTESDLSNTTKIPEDLLRKKYYITNLDLSQKVFAYIRSNFSVDFDPTKNILNLYVMQRAFAYYLLYLLYADLMISAEGFDNYKSVSYYEKYSSMLKDALALIQLDYDEDGEVDWDEQKNSVSTKFLVR